MVTVHRPHALSLEVREGEGYIEEGCFSFGQHPDCCCEFSWYDSCYRSGERGKNGENFAEKSVKLAGES